MHFGDARLFDVNLERAAYERMGASCYRLLDPQVPSLTAFELDGGGSYRAGAMAVGEEELAVERPFPFRARPADLVTR